MSAKLMESTKASQSTRVISFESAQVNGGVAGGYFLTVSGEAPCLNMKVDLIPLIYIICPEYWEIEVVGTLPGGFCLEAMRPFTETIPLTGITGKKGIEVVGANRSERFDVADGCS